MPYPPPAAAPAAPPPPALQKSSLANASATCPLQRTGECAIDYFKVSVTPVSSKSGAKPMRWLDTTKILRNSKTTITDPIVVGLLGRYDLVLDVLADPPTHENPKPENAVTILAEGNFHGDCTAHAHPSIYLVSKDEAPELPPGGVYWNAIKSEPRDFYAPGIWGDTIGDATPFGFFWALLQQLCAGPKQLELAGKACGAKHFLGYSREPDVVLNCLVRVYRKDTWTLELHIASYRVKSYKREKATGLQVTQGTTEKRTYTETTGGTTRTDTGTKTSGFQQGSTLTPFTAVPSKEVSTTSVTKASPNSGQYNTTTTSTDPAANPLTVSSHRLASPGGDTFDTGDHKDFVVTPDGKAPTPDPKDSNKNQWTKLGNGWVRDSKQGGTPPPRVDVNLIRNGQKLRLTEDIRRFSENVGTLKDTIDQFAALLKKAPQVGWSFGYSLAFLEGTVDGTVERVQDEVYENTKQDGRYLPVGWRGTVSFSLMLVSFSATASFGVKYDLGWLAGAEATLNGTFATTIKLSGSVNTNKDADLTLTPDVDAKIEGVLRASAAGVTLFDVRVTLEGGLTILDLSKTPPAPGGLTWRTGFGFGFNGDLATKETTVKFTAVSPRGAMEPYSHTLLPPKKLMNLQKRAVH